VVGAVALVAGGAPLVALTLGVAMTSLQMAIGALNDLVDAPHDLGRKPGKPIPSGLVAPWAAVAVVVGGSAVGATLAALAAADDAAPAMLGLTGLVLAIGFGYDLLAKGTAWSWLPFALGIPLLPVYGWFGATGLPPGWFAALVPTAAIAGAALAIANARVDLERDLAAGIGSVAVRFGDAGSWGIHAVLWSIVVAIALGWLIVADRGASIVLAVGAASLPILVGVAIGRTGGPARRERAWEIEAVGALVLAVAWLLAVGPAP
jgi:4-hydroxybenzoate polyprenyltransferase